MAGLAHHSAACSNLLSTFCGLAVDACSPRDTITAFLEVLGNLVDGRCALPNRQGCFPCMLLGASVQCVSRHCEIYCHVSYMGVHAALRRALCSDNGLRCNNHSCICNAGPDQTACSLPATFLPCCQSKFQSSHGARQLMLLSAVQLLDSWPRCVLSTRQGHYCSCMLVRCRAQLICFSWHFSRHDRCCTPALWALAQQSRRRAGK
jgi:hypothetical protein